MATRITPATQEGPPLPMVPMVTVPKLTPIPESKIIPATPVHKQVMAILKQALEFVEENSDLTLDDAADLIEDLMANLCDGIDGMAEYLEEDDEDPAPSRKDPLWGE